MTDIQSRPDTPPPGLSVIYTPILGTIAGQGFLHRVWGAAYIALTSQYRPSSTRREERQKGESRNSLSPAGPPNGASDACRVKIKYMDATGDLQVQDVKLPPSPLLASRQCLSDRSQGTGPWIFWLPVICSPHALPENNSASIPSANTGLRELSHGPWTRPSRGWRSGGHTHSNPASHGYPHAQFQNGSNWVRRLLIGPCDRGSM